MMNSQLYSSQKW